MGEGGSTGEMLHVLGPYGMEVVTKLGDSHSRPHPAEDKEDGIEILGNKGQIS